MAQVKLKVRSSPPRQFSRRLRSLITVKVLKTLPPPSRPPSGTRKTIFPSSFGKQGTLLHVPRVNRMPPSSTNHPTATPQPPGFDDVTCGHPSHGSAKQPTVLHSPPQPRMMRRLRRPRSSIQRQASYLLLQFSKSPSKAPTHPEAQNPSPPVALDQKHQRCQHLVPTT